MSRTSQVARRLLANALPGDKVSGVVYRHAKISDPFVMPTPLPAEHALASAKSDGWQAAATQAISASDPKVLTKLSRDSRRQVRRAVAENLATGEELLEYLYHWAVKNKDEDTLASTVRRCDLAWLLEDEQIPVDNLGEWPWAILAGRLVEDPELLARAVDKELWHLDREICFHLASGPVHGISLTMLVSRWLNSDSPQRCGALLDRALGAGYGRDYRYVKITLEAAQCLLMAGNHPSHYGLHNRAIESAAVDVLVASTLQWQRNIAAQGLVSDSEVTQTEIDRLLAVTIDEDGEPVEVDEADLESLRGRLNEQQVDRLLSWPWAENKDVIDSLAERISELTERQVERILMARTVLGHPLPGGYTLAKKPVALSDASLMLALQAGSIGLTATWLAGKIGHSVPKSGQIVELFAHPGKALRSEMSGYYYRNTPQEEPTMAQVASSLGRQFEAIATQPWVDELVECLGSGFFALASNDDSAAGYLSAKLTEGIGVDPETWELALGLLDSFEGSVSHLVATVRRLAKASGRELIMADGAVVA